MPWHVSEGPDSRCPAEKPWAVILDSDGSVVGCHMTKANAQSQVNALYANVDVEGGKMRTKFRDATFKALEGDGHAPGTFSAVVAVYDNVDKDGDRIREGAFDRTLAAWRKSGDPIPIVLAHQWKDPWAHIGWADPNDVKSVSGVGLVVEKGHLDLDNPTAAQVYKLMQRRTMKEFSFGYGVKKSGLKKAQDGAWDMHELDLYELGPCLKGVNDKTALLSIKSLVESSEVEADDSGQDNILDRLAKLEERVESLAAHDESVETEEMVEVEVPDIVGTPPAVFAGDIDQEIALLSAETQLTAMENDPDIREVTSKSTSSDEIQKKIEMYERDL